jgi:hypothetical protein
MRAPKVPAIERLPLLAFLIHLAQELKATGCLEEMKHTQDAVALLYKKASDEAFNQVKEEANAVSFFKLNLDLHLGLLSWQLGARDLPKSLLSSVVSTLESARWSPGKEYKMAAVLLAGMGHDDEASRILNQYEKFYDERFPRVEDSAEYSQHWMYRIDNWAWMAYAQAAAGHREAARETLTRTLVKARSLPVGRLNDIYGTRANGLGEGNALQSAGLMSIVWVAAEIVEIAIALEAYNAASPLARLGGAPGVLIAALAKNGQIDKALDLVRQHECQSLAIPLGLLESNDWKGAIRAHETQLCDPKGAQCYKNECEFDSVLLPIRAQLVDGLYLDRPLRLDYYMSMGKAKARVQGTSSALEWARRQPGLTEKVGALLGVATAVREF